MFQSWQAAQSNIWIAIQGQSYIIFLALGVTVKLAPLCHTYCTITTHGLIIIIALPLAVCLAINGVWGGSFPCSSPPPLHGSRMYQIRYGSLNEDKPIWYVGREIEGARAPPPTLKDGGRAPSFFKYAYVELLFSMRMPYTIKRSLKTTARRPQKHSPRIVNSKFSWGSIPPDPSRWL